MKSNTITIDPANLSVKELYPLLVGTIAPRPIALVSTLSQAGIPNLAPFSYFNVFSSDPPIVVFSPGRKSPTTQKDTLNNLLEMGEAVVNLVSFGMVRKMAVTSVAFPEEVDEFEKSGFAPLPSAKVKPFRVQESPVQLECVVEEIKPLGNKPGSGNLVICRIVQMHVDQLIFDERGRINPHKIDLVGRLGRAYYVRASGESVHTIIQPQKEICIGYDQLPESIKKSHILTANDIGRLAGLKDFPSQESIDDIRQHPRVAKALGGLNPVKQLHLIIQDELSKENRELAGSIAWLAASVSD